MRERVRFPRAHCHRRGLGLGTAAESEMRVRPKKMPLLQWLRRDTARGDPRPGSAWGRGGQVRVRGRCCQPPRRQARGGGSGPRQARAPMRASEAADPLLVLVLGESRRGEAWPGCGGGRGGVGRDPVRAGPEQPMRGKGRWVCRDSCSPQDNGGGERERRNVGRWGGAEKAGSAPSEGVDWGALGGVTRLSPISLTISRFPRKGRG